MIKYLSLKNNFKFNMETKKNLGIEIQGKKIVLDACPQWNRNLNKLVEDKVVFDFDAIKKLFDSKGNIEIYRVYSLTKLPEFEEICRKTKINCDVTVLHSGILSEGDEGEAYMTYGHMHETKRNEIYKVVEGEAFLVMYNDENEIVINMKKNDEFLINSEFIHRLYSIKGAIVLGFVPSDAGHNYNIVKNKGFPYTIFYNKKNEDIIYKKNKKFTDRNLIFRKPQKLNTEELFFKNPKELEKMLF